MSQSKTILNYFTKVCGAYNCVVFDLTLYLVIHVLEK